MIKPRRLEVGVWKENEHKKKRSEWRPTFSFLVEKYLQEQERGDFSRNMHRRSPGYRGYEGARGDY
jgi:hypothetical protein